MHYCLLISLCPIEATPLMSAMSFSWTRIQAGTCLMLSIADQSPHLVHIAELALFLPQTDHRYTMQRIWHIVDFQYGFTSSTFSLVLFQLIFTWLFSFFFFHFSVLFLENEIIVSHLRELTSWILGWVRNSFVSMIHCIKMTTYSDR